MISVLTEIYELYARLIAEIKVPAPSSTALYCFLVEACFFWCLISVLFRLLYKDSSLILLESDDPCDVNEFFS